MGCNLYYVGPLSCILKCDRGISYVASAMAYSTTETRQYSKTSKNGPSEKRTTSVQRTAHLPPIDFTIELIHFEKRTPLNSEQRTLISPRRILKTDSEVTPTYCGRLSTAFVTPPLLESKTKHYISTIAHRAIPSRHGKQWRGPKNYATSSSSTISDCHAYRKYTESL